MAAKTDKRVAIDEERAQLALDSDAPKRVARYFTSNGKARELFTGRMFERLGSSTPNRFTSDDIVAVSTLSVVVPPRTAIELLEESDLSTEANSLLAQIPEIEIWTCTPERDLDRGSPADKLDALLKAERGIDRVIASKLVARKRPHLLPIYDSVVAQTVLGRDKTWDWWLPVYEYMKVDENRRRLDEVRAEASLLLSERRDHGLLEDISLLRVFDVALWMYGKA